MKTYYSWFVVLLIALVGCDKVGKLVKPAPPPKPVADIADAKAKVAGDMVFGAVTQPVPPAPPAPKPGEKCPVCDGTGKVGDGRVFAPCGSCKGTGKVLAPGAAIPTLAEPPIPPTPSREPAQDTIPFSPQYQLDARPLIEPIMVEIHDRTVQALNVVKGAVDVAAQVDSRGAEPATQPTTPPVDPSPVQAVPTVFERVVNVGRRRRVIIFTNTKTCVICKTQTAPELVTLFKTYQYIMGPSANAHIEIIDTAVETKIARYDATAAEVAAALGKSIEAIPLYVLIDAGGVIKSSHYDGPNTARNLLLGLTNG